VKATLALAGVVVLAAAHMALGADTRGQEKGASSGPVFRPAFFSPELTNRYFPWAKVERTVLEGRQKVDGKIVAIREVATRGNQHINISGVLTTYLEVLAYTGRHLDERAKDYFAQGKDGWVYYLGEDVDEFENGKVVHAGSWKVGWNETEPQKFVPRYPAKVGMRFNQESVPGVAVEQVTIVGVDETVKTPAGTFRHCLHWREYDPLRRLRREVARARRGLREGDLRRRFPRPDEGRAGLSGGDSEGMVTRREPATAPRSGCGDPA